MRKNAKFPDYLYEPRPGYYVWKDPRDGKTHVLGRISLAEAIYQAQEANVIVANSKATRTLAERLTEKQNTIADLIERMPSEGMKASTLKTRSYIDGAIKNGLGTVKCAELTTKQVADFIEPIVESGKKRWAQSIRNRLITICRRGNSLGWMTGNPVLETERPRPKTKRRRLTLEVFHAIYEKASQVNDWLQNAMLLALVSGQDRSTIGRWQRSFSSGDVVLLQRSKTSIKIEIPLALRLDVIGMSLADVIAKCKSTGVVSKFLIHHIRNQGRAKTGTHVKLGSISQSFADARTLAGIPDDEFAPTFHEIRSLSKRLYDDQGNVDTKALLGHMTDAMAEMYADSRGIAPVKVTINKPSSKQVLNSN